MPLPPSNRPSGICAPHTSTIGEWGQAYERVPTILLNYLLYELAFYRVGFFWGACYDHTCDASHFGPGELNPSVHSDSPLALRKVFEYIDE